MLADLIKGLKSYSRVQRLIKRNGIATAEVRILPTTRLFRNGKECGSIGRSDMRHPERAHRGSKNQPASDMTAMKLGLNHRPLPSGSKTDEIITISHQSTTATSPVSRIVSAAS